MKNSKHANPGDGLEGRSIFGKSRHESCSNPVRLIRKGYHLEKISRVFAKRRSIIVQCHFHETPIIHYLEHYDVWYFREARLAYKAYFASLAPSEIQRLKESSIGDLLREAVQGRDGSESSCSSSDSSSSSSSSDSENSDCQIEVDTDSTEKVDVQMLLDQTLTSAGSNRKTSKIKESFESIDIVTPLQESTPLRTSKDSSIRVASSGYDDPRANQLPTYKDASDPMAFENECKIKMVEKVLYRGEDILIHVYLEGYEGPFCFHHYHYLKLPKAVPRLYDYFMSLSEKTRKRFKSSVVANLYRETIKRGQAYRRTTR